MESSNNYKTPKLYQEAKPNNLVLAKTYFDLVACRIIRYPLVSDKKLVNITFKDAVVDPDDVETLQDMTTQAINDALSQIDDATQKTLGAFAGKLPF